MIVTPFHEIPYFDVVQNLQDIVQEQITRVLLERLIVNRPHPWGLLITFVELIKVSYHGSLNEF